MEKAQTKMVTRAIISTYFGLDVLDRKGSDGRHLHVLLVVLLLRLRLSHHLDLVRHQLVLLLSGVLLDEVGGVLKDLLRLSQHLHVLLVVLLLRIRLSHHLDLVRHHLVLLLGVVLLDEVGGVDRRGSLLRVHVLLVVFLLRLRLSHQLDLVRHRLVLLLGGLVLDEVGGVLKDVEKSANKNSIGLDYLDRRVVDGAVVGEGVCSVSATTSTYGKATTSEDKQKWSHKNAINTSYKKYRPL
jgi:hypothetical protein